MGQSARSVAQLSSVFRSKSRESCRVTLSRALELTIDLLLRASEVNGLDTANLLLGRAGDGASGHSGGPDGVHGRHKGAALNSGRRQLAAQWGTESLGKASGGHFGWNWEWRWDREKCNWRREWGVNGFMFSPSCESNGEIFVFFWQPKLFTDFGCCVLDFVGHAVGGSLLLGLRGWPNHCGSCGGDPCHPCFYGDPQQLKARHGGLCPAGLQLSLSCPPSVHARLPDNGGFGE